jgi:GT2 family glycosyltransferase/glycosyltransferase involved in cell wall biosynthesis
MSLAKRILRALPLLLLSPLLFALVALAMLAADLAWFVAGRRASAAPPAAPDSTAASVVIPNWNGRDLLARYLPSIVAALAGNPANEIVVVDNGSSDGSAEFVRTNFPQVTLVALQENLGFGGGSNAGFRAAANDIVVLLNSDMRVAPDFLAPLLEGFRDPLVFAVSCQIFFADPAKVREETGLTQGWWEDGQLRVRHRIDPQVDTLFPCFYGGGGSCAFDRRKFLELGGFDELLAPFYLEDTDLGYMAWKRGWKVLYQPRSVVYHEHRGTIGKRFREDQIQAVLKKNYLLWSWKNIHAWPRLVSQLAFTWVGALLAVVFGDVPLRPNFAAVWRAFRQLPGAVRSRWRARSLAVVGDAEAFRRPMGGYFRDRFAPMEADPERLRVLFVSPYPINPPTHGGAVFMSQTLAELARLAETHVVGMLDWPWQEADNRQLAEFCASSEWIARPTGRTRGSASLTPHAVREFRDPDFEWLIHRQLLLRRIDVLQLEYTPLAQYRCGFRRIPTALFEHDVSFQSIARGFGHSMSATAEMKARMEYLRMLRYELRVLPPFDQVQVCTAINRRYLLGFLPRMAARLRPGLRAGIDTRRYSLPAVAREPATLLFVGSFRHDPNRAAVDWFVHEVLPLVLRRRPDARLILVGSDPPPAHTYADYSANLEMLGYVDDVRGPLSRYAAFVCPILSGSGVRVKLLEAFAAGIPVVSTTIGAEGLAAVDGEYCSLADDPAAFAERVVAILDDPAGAARMAAQARAMVETEWDMAAITRRLVDEYRQLVRRKRAAAPGAGPILDAANSPAPLSASSGSGLS